MLAKAFFGLAVTKIMEAKMHTKHNSEGYDSPLLDLVPAVLFVAGLMGLVALLSQV